MIGAVHWSAQCYCAGLYQGCTHGTGQGSCPHPIDNTRDLLWCTGCGQRRGEHIERTLSDALADLVR